MSSLLLLISCVCLFSRAAARDTISINEPLRDGETLVSSGRKVQLGFFRPSNSSARRYAGVWYYGYPSETILWVANRENPVLDGRGTLTISGDGNLVVLDGGGKVVWTSNASVSSNASTAQLLDSGNLLLYDSGNAVWRSFDHPTDSYVEGMKVGLDLRTGVNQLFTSWRSAEDPAVGNFSVGNDPRRSTQLFVWEGARPRWRSGMYDGQDFIGMPTSSSSYIYGIKQSSFQLEQKLYYYFTTFNGTARYVITWDGILVWQQWDKAAGKWNQLWAEPVTQCELYNRCGRHASCTNGETPMCRCLPGFEPASVMEWREGNWTRGCIRRTPLACETNTTTIRSSNTNSNSTAATDEVEPDGFEKLEGVKVPDMADWVNERDQGACQRSCLTNCSCKAFAYTSGIGCLQWGVELVDIHKFARGGRDMYLRLAGSELIPEKGEGKKKKKVAVVVIVIVLSGIFSVIGSIYLIWKCKGRIKEFLKSSKTEKVPLQSQGTSREVKQGFSTILKLTEGQEDGKASELPLFTFDSIVSATNGFSDSNYLGKGGFGPVYKGKLAGGQEIAVKRLSSSSGQGMEEFKNEVLLIAKLQHRNLVRLLGCCCEGGEKILVYEYLPNRSLDVFLFDMTMKRQLDWRTRYNIIEGIARGLLYLHRDSRLRIIHRDLKVSNILLDEEMNPKISDFGMARIFGNDDNPTNTKRVAGTYGYMSPEYAMRGLFSVKSDVYSFGVLLLEIVSGKRNSSFCDPETSLNLLAYAWHLWNQERAMELVDQSMSSSCSRAAVLRCISLALLCVQDRAADRPNISSVVTMLESETIAQALPKRPTFTADRSSSCTESSSVDLKASSAEVSITMVTGR